MDTPTPRSTLAEKTEWLRAAGCNLGRLPPHMRDGTADYILFGVPQGSFATAVFSNDLKEAFGRADEANQAAMREWVMFIYNEAPSASQGSPERVRGWQAQGGILHFRRETAA